MDSTDVLIVAIVLGGLLLVVLFLRKIGLR